MALKERVARLLTRIRPHVRRVAYCGFIFSFALPFVDVMHCSTNKKTTYRGYELLSGDEAVFYIITILIFAALMGFSFYRKDRGRALAAFAACWRAIPAAVAGLIIGLLPPIQFLFHTVLIRAGQFLGLLCAGIVFIDGMADAAAGYVALKREDRSAVGGGSSKGLRTFHTAVLLASLALAPVYIIGLSEDIDIALLFLLLLSLPFALAQLIVLEAVRRGEGWPRPWAAAAAVLLAGGAALSVMSIL
ncbi:MAG: hypothetical protein JXA07_02455 [Spirochaetes bacterium]|nr:hypothetical protein [Spirochaetota bacterium]